VERGAGAGDGERGGGGVIDDDEDELSPNGERLCVICGGEGFVEGRDHLDWDESGYDDLIECTSCKGSGLAKDMTWC
jgi:hypothetical protein